MTKEETILQLENLKEHCNEMSKSNKMWESDVIALNIAIDSMTKFTKVKEALENKTRGISNNMN